MRGAWIIGLASMGWIATAAAQDACSKLASLQLPDTRILTAETIPAGIYSTIVPGPPNPPELKVQLPAHCRVTGSIRPTSDSDIRFEVWLPVSGWNHRYDQTGNGGLAGVMPDFRMIDPLLRGAVVAMTDDGHVGATPFDGSWAKGHPERLIDYGYRAVHLTALSGQALTAAYYGQKAGHAYFIGCSDGGRESLMEAQRFPQDFDGFLVGAPGIDIPRNGLTHLHVLQTLNALGTAQALTPALLQTLSAAVLQKCDAIDGVKDGVLRDPRQCRFDPHELICKAGTHAGCLSPAQADAVQSVLEGPRDPKTGRQLAPGAWGTLGTESTAWPGIFLGGAGLPPLIEFADRGIISALLYGDPQRDLASVDPVKADADIQKKLAPIINSDNPDLRAARQNNRKILHFHGWADPNISPEYSVAYFEAVQRFLGGDTGDFYRLFMVPGMAHCAGGVGPTTVGDVTGSASSDPQRDWLTALERWVEQGVAPEKIIATEYEPGPPNVATKAIRTRPLCPYPAVAVYRGAGSMDEAASFQCRAPSAP